MDSASWTKRMKDGLEEEEGLEMGKENEGENMKEERPRANKTWWCPRERSTCRVTPRVAKT